MPYHGSHSDLRTCKREIGQGKVVKCENMMKVVRVWYTSIMDKKYTVMVDYDWSTGGGVS